MSFTTAHDSSGSGSGSGPGSGSGSNSSFCLNYPKKIILIIFWYILYIKQYLMFNFFLLNWGCLFEGTTPMKLIVK